MLEKTFKSVEEVDAHAHNCSRQKSHKSARYPHYYEFADLYYKLGAYSKALAYLKVLVDNGVTSVRVLSLYGDCLSQLGRSKEDELRKERSISKSATTDDCSISENGLAMPSSITEADTFFDASDLDTEKKSCSLLLECPLIEAVRAVSIGDEPSSFLSSVESNAKQLEETGQPSSHLLIYLISLIRNDLRGYCAEHTLSYLKRLIRQIDIGEGTLDAKIIDEAKLNLAMSTVLYILSSRQNLTKEELHWCGKIFNRLRKRPDVADRVWRPIADERYTFCSLYSIYLERHGYQQDEKDGVAVDCTFDDETKQLIKQIDEIGDNSNVSDFTSEDLAGYIERNPNRIDAIVWMCYCFWLQKDDRLLPTDLNFARHKQADGNTWLDRYCYLFGLEHMFKQSHDQWYVREMPAVVLTPYLISTSLEYPPRYAEGWWLLNSRLADKADETKLSRLSAMLRLDHDHLSRPELICPSALLTMASCLSHLAKSVDDKERKEAILERSQTYLTTLLSLYSDSVRRVCRSKLWFACDEPVPMDKRAFKYQIESELSDVLASRGAYDSAIGVLSASENRSLQRNVQLLQLLRREPDVYRDRAQKLCRQIFQDLKKDETDPGYQVVSDAAKSLETSREDREEDRVLKAMFPIMETLSEALPSIQSLQTALMWMKDNCVAHVESLQLRRLMMADQIRNLTGDIAVFRESIREQKQLLVDWYNGEDNKQQEFTAIQRASLAAECALESLNERMARLRLA